MSSTGAKNLLQGDDNGHVGRPGEVSLAPPCPELCLRVTGPLPSLVLRTEDIWQKLETNVIEVAGSQSGFPKKPFSPLMSTCAVSSKHKDAEHRPQRGLDD